MPGADSCVMLLNAASVLAINAIVVYHKFIDKMLSADPTLERAFKGHKGPTTCLAWNNNMRQLASGGADGNVMIWNFKPQLRAFKFTGHTVSCNSYPSPELSS